MNDLKEKLGIDKLLNRVTCHINEVTPKCKEKLNYSRYGYANRKLKVKKLLCLEKTV